MHMQQRDAVFIGEKGSGAGNLVGVFQKPLHRLKRQQPILLRPDHQATAVIGAAEDGERRGMDFLFRGKSLKHLMDDFAIFEAENKNPALSGF